MFLLAVAAFSLRDLIALTADMLIFLTVGCTILIVMAIFFESWIQDIVRYHRSVKLRQAAARALGRLGYPESAPSLAQALFDKNLHNAAEQALLLTLPQIDVTHYGLFDRYDPFALARITTHENDVLVLKALAAIEPLKSAETASAGKDGAVPRLAADRRRTYAPA